MNNVEILPRGLFIEMVRFAPGSQIPLFETGSGGREYALQNVNTPRGTELVRRFLYALIIEDHFLYVSREIAMNRNEGFMEWMLAAMSLSQNRIWRVDWRWRDRSSPRSSGPRSHRCFRLNGPSPRAVDLEHPTARR